MKQSAKDAFLAILETEDPAHQGNTVLMTGPETMCALGLYLNRIMGIPYEEYKRRTGKGSDHGASLYEAIRTHSGMTVHETCAITRANDAAKKSFKEIAEIVKGFPVDPENTEEKVE